MPAAIVPSTSIRRWRRVEYDRLIELGVFRPGERLELLDGVLIVREPQGTRHAAGIRRVVAALHAVLRDAWQIDSQLPIALDDDSEPEPDVAVVAREASNYRDAHPSQPQLIVEITESSYRIDRDYKASLYARAGVRDYWIVDVLRGVVEVLREPEESQDAPYGWRYSSIVALRPPATVAPLVAPVSTIAVASLLP